jgi:hypothetical protein
MERKMASENSGLTTISFPSGSYLGQDWSLSSSDYQSATIRTLSSAKPDDFQKISGATINLISQYYDTYHGQARRSFNWALAGAITGFVFYVCAIIIFILTDENTGAWISAISGSFLQIVSGIVFYLYRNSSAHMATSHAMLDRTQRYILANSICERMAEKLRDETRQALVKIIADAKEPELS